MEGTERDRRRRNGRGSNGGALEEKMETLLYRKNRWWFISDSIDIDIFCKEEECNFCNGERDGETIAEWRTKNGLSGERLNLLQHILKKAEKQSKAKSPVENIFLDLKLKDIESEEEGEDIDSVLRRLENIISGWQS